MGGTGQCFRISIQQEIEYRLGIMQLEEKNGESRNQVNENQQSNYRCTERQWHIQSHAVVCMQIIGRIMTEEAPSRAVTGRREKNICGMAYQVLASTVQTTKSA
jgi:hypothetical protein